MAVSGQDNSDDYYFMDILCDMINGRGGGGGGGAAPSGSADLHDMADKLAGSQLRQDI